MKLDDSFDLVALRPIVWDYFLDVEKLARCIPGMESVEQVDDTHYKGTLVVQLGPVKPKFVGDVTIDEKVAPKRMTGSFQAKDRGASSNISAKFVFDLIEKEPNLTTAHYDCDLVIRGRMAAFGASVIAETAKQLAAAFAAALQEELNAAQAPELVGAQVATVAPGVSRAVAAPRPKVSLVAIFFESVWTVITDKLARLFHRKGADTHG